MSDALQHKRRQIFGMCRELKLDDDLRQAIQTEATGKTSLTVMTSADMDKVIDALKAKGWKAKAAGGFKKETRGDLRLIWVLWGKLVAVGRMPKGRKALNNFISSGKFGPKWGHEPTDVSFLSVERAQDVIEALKDICKRSGVKVDK